MDALLTNVTSDNDTTNTIPLTYGGNKEKTQAGKSVFYPAMPTPAFAIKHPAEKSAHFSGYAKTQSATVQTSSAFILPDDFSGVPGQFKTAYFACSIPPKSDGGRLRHLPPKYKKQVLHKAPLFKPFCCKPLVRVIYFWYGRYWHCKRSARIFTCLGRGQERDSFDHNCRGLYRRSSS